MAITKKLIHFNEFSNFNAQKLSANRENTSYTVGVDGELTVGEPYILFHSIVFIKDVLKIWTHGSLYECSETDLSDYLTAEEIAEVYATIDALNGKQDTVADLESIRQGAALGATALQEHQDISGKLDKSEAESTYATIDALNGKQDTVADLETIRQGAALGATALQEHQDISGKLDKSEAKDTYATIESLDTVESIARGKSRAKVFDTIEALDEWLSVPENLEELQVGDNFYISSTDVPDYWWDGSQKQPLETEKVDLTEYAKKSDIPIKVSELEDDLSIVTLNDSTPIVGSLAGDELIPIKQDGENKAVSIEQIKNEVINNGIIEFPSKYEFVDLGLPSGTKWATCNVGANSPEEAGLYFAWGET